MMRNISTFHRLATAAIEKTAGGNAEGAKITLNIIKQRMGDTLYKVGATNTSYTGSCVHCLPMFIRTADRACAVDA